MSGNSFLRFFHCLHTFPQFFHFRIFDLYTPILSCSNKQIYVIRTWEGKKFKDVCFTICNDDDMGISGYCFLCRFYAFKPTITLFFLNWQLLAFRLLSFFLLITAPDLLMHQTIWHTIRTHSKHGMHMDSLRSPPVNWPQASCCLMRHVIQRSCVLNS